MALLGYSGGASYGTATSLPLSSRANAPCPAAIDLKPPGIGMLDFFFIFLGSPVELSGVRSAA